MKKIILTFFFSSCFLIIASCTQQAWYEGSKNNHEIRCLQESSSEYENCLNENKHSFEQYQEAKDQLKEDNK